jgi:hypothetical protein
MMDPVQVMLWAGAVAAVMVALVVVVAAVTMLRAFLVRDRDESSGVKQIDLGGRS